MPRNGSGTYTRTQPDYVTNTTINSNAVNSELNDMASALTSSLARDGQTVPTANLPMGGFRLTGLGNATAATDAATLSQVDGRAEVTIASASTTDIGAQNSGNIYITGTTTINSFGTAANGVTRRLRFENSLTLTYNSTSLIVPGYANIITSPGDTMIAQSFGSGTWVITSYTPSAGSILVGQIAYFPANVAPGGWLKANGSVLSRTSFPALWAFANTSGNIVSDATWGSPPYPIGSFSTGDGSTTFRIPDLRGEFVRSWDDARGVDSGRAIGSYQADAMQGHLHLPASGTTFWGNNGTHGSGQPTGGTFAVTGTTTGSPVSDGTNGFARTAAETRPRNVALLACIKV